MIDPLRLDRPWRVLSGDSSPEFELEPALSLFQVKAHLNSATAGAYGPRDAALIFGSVHISDWMSRSEYDYDNDAPARYFSDRNNAALFTRCFRHGSVYRLTEIQDLDRTRRQYKKSSWELPYHAKLTAVRLAIFHSRKGDRLTDAKTILHEHMNPPGVPGASKCRKAVVFESKAALIFGAAKACPQLLGFRYKRKTLISELVREVPSTDEFRRFCSFALYAAEKLELDGVALLKRYTTVEATEPPPDSDIPLDRVESLRMKKDRNSAAETNKSKRQPQKAVGM